MSNSDAPAGLPSPLSREELYELVWSEPMLRIGERLGVSSSYMARVCTELRVPRPARGYWAQREFGKAVPQRPPLPPARPGDVTRWRPGLALPSRPVSSASLPGEPRARNAGRQPSSVRHELLVGAKSHFLKTRTTEDGLLRPYKRMLVDVISSEKQLDAVLDAANALFLAFEAQGHRVTLAPPGMQMRRAAVNERESPTSRQQYGYGLWSPDRITAVYIGEVPVGLTLFETTEEVKVVYVEGRYLPLDGLTLAELRRYQGPRHWTTEKTRPSGRFCLQAYCPHARVNWSKQWRAASAKEVAVLAPAVVQELVSAAPTLVGLIAQAKAEAEEQRRQWEEESRLRREEAERARLAKLRQDSRAELLAAIEAWDHVRRVQDWLANVEREVQRLEEEERAHLVGRLKEARALIGSADALDLLKRWKAPSERN